MKRTMFYALCVSLLTLIGGGGFLQSSCQAANLTVKGSDTMLMLGQAWAEAFMKKNNKIDVSIQGGGSGTGISALINKTCDIAAASRPMKAKEIEKCKEKNIMPIATAVAMDGVSFAVNSANPVKTFTLAQLKDIYTGKVRNWKQVGGNDAPIVVLSRESSSGTYVYIQDTMLKGAKYAKTALLMPSTKAIQQEITNNKNAIGYGGVAYFINKKNIKIVPLALKAGAAAIHPTDDNVRSKKYPLSRPLYFYTPGKPKGAAAEFINFALSAEGQKLVTSTGYVSLK